MLTLLAAFCDRWDFDYRARGAAERVREMTEQIGAPLDAETISKVLRDLPDPVESRRK